VPHRHRDQGRIEAIFLTLLRKQIFILTQRLRQGGIILNLILVNFGCAVL